MRLPLAAVASMATCFAVAVAGMALSNGLSLGHAAMLAAGAEVPTLPGLLLFRWLVAHDIRPNGLVSFGQPAVVEGVRLVRVCSVLAMVRFDCRMKRGLRFALGGLVLGPREILKLVDSLERYPSVMGSPAGR